MSKSDPNAPKRLALIASKGTLDWAYPPFILATAAGAMGWEVGIFFTFYGLPLLKPKLSAAVTPIGRSASFENKGVASVEELRQMAIDLDVRMIGCQMTMDVFGFKREDFIKECEIGGAATFLEYAADADVQLFV